MSRADAAGRALATGSQRAEDPSRGRPGAAPQRPDGPWPHGVSRRATMRISDVLAELRTDFPAVSTSKLRYLEDEGLVSPLRTPSGYRQYSQADVERLRYVLRQQRDRFWPLSVIREHLAAMDRGEGDEQEPLAHVVRSPEESAAAHPSRYTMDALAEAAGTTPAMVAELVAAGVVGPDAAGHFDPWARDVVRSAAALAEHGITARHLRAFTVAAERQVALVDQVVAPVRGQSAPSARAHAGTLAAEVGELCGQLHTALLRSGVARIAP